MEKAKRKMTTVSRIHYVKLALRGLLFLAALAAYIAARLRQAPEMFGGCDSWLWLIITVPFSVEMILRCFPSKYESMGCQKQFAVNFEALGEYDRRKLLKDSPRQTLPVLLSWIALNGLIAMLYFAGLIDWGILVLISLAYSVCDMICILFYCPFQSLMMKNRCCGSCRIYNWDFAMMFTPMLFIDHVCACVLAGLALLLLVIWELGFRLHPEHFSEKTNACLSCANCPEKLCHHKKQLRSFHRKLLRETKDQFT